MEFEKHLIESLENGICERGNHAFSYPESGKAVIFAKMGDDRYFQAAYTPENHPSWDCSVTPMSDEELKDHIRTRLGGWNVDKCQFEDIAVTPTGKVKDLEDEVEFDEE